MKLGYLIMSVCVFFVCMPARGMLQHTKKQQERVPLWHKKEVLEANRDHINTLHSCAKHYTRINHAATLVYCGAKAVSLYAGSENMISACDPTYLGCSFAMGLVGWWWLGMLKSHYDDRIKEVEYEQTKRKKC